jgi:hypothetical protein
MLTDVLFFKLLLYSVVYRCLKFSLVKKIPFHLYILFCLILLLEQTFVILFVCCL